MKSEPGFSTIREDASAGRTPVSAASVVGLGRGGFSLRNLLRGGWHRRCNKGARTRHGAADNTRGRSF